MESNRIFVCIVAISCVFLLWGGVAVMLSFSTISMWGILRTGTRDGELFFLSKASEIHLFKLSRLEHYKVEVSIISQEDVLVLGKENAGPDKAGEGGDQNKSIGQRIQSTQTGKTYRQNHTCGGVIQFNSIGSPSPPLPRSPLAAYNSV